MKNFNNRCNEWWKEWAGILFNLLWLLPFFTYFYRGIKESNTFSDIKWFLYATIVVIILLMFLIVQKVASYQEIMSEMNDEIEELKKEIEELKQDK